MQWTMCIISHPTLLSFIHIYGHMHSWIWHHRKWCTTFTEWCVMCPLKSYRVGCSNDKNSNECFPWICSGRVLVVTCWGTCINMPDCTFTFCICIYTSHSLASTLASNGHQSAKQCSDTGTLLVVTGETTTTTNTTCTTGNSASCVQFHSLLFFWYCTGILGIVLCNGNAKATDWLILDFLPAHQPFGDISSMHTLSNADLLIALRLFTSLV